MTFKPGQSGNPEGRRKGTPNKATVNAREAIAEFVEGNVDRLTSWLDEIALDDPKAAFTCFMDVVEYHIPKLARTEIEAEHKGNLTIEIVKFSENTNPSQ